MKQPCEVIQDLLPLYVDGIASKESIGLVDEHLHICHTCQQYHNSLKLDAVQRQTNLDSNVSRLKQSIRRHTWKQILVSSLVSILLLPLVFLMYTSYVALEGTTFNSLLAHWLANEAFDAIVKKDYNLAQEYLGFWGYNEDRTEMGDHLIGEEKERWIVNMERFANQYHILEAKVNRSYTDDGFTKVYVDLTITDNEEIYEFQLDVAYYGKRDHRPNQLYPATIRPKYEPYLYHMNPQTMERMYQVGNDLMDIIFTYNPG